MSTSLTGDLANLSICGSEMSATEKALTAASMTASFDSSLLSSNSNDGGSTGGQRKQSSSKTLTKEQLEERSAILLKQQMAEREKRKSVCVLNCFLHFTYLKIDCLL